MKFSFSLDYVRIFVLRDPERLMEAQARLMGLHYERKTPVPQRKSLSKDESMIAKALERFLDDHAGYIRADYDLRACDAIFAGNLTEAFTAVENGLLLERSLGRPIPTAEAEFARISMKMTDTSIA